MNPTNSPTKDEIEKWLDPVLTKLDIHDYKINITGNNEKGDGYIGDITYVEVRGKRKDGEDNIYNFVIKSGKKSPQLRKKMPIREAFLNEIYFYTEVLPTFDDFQKEKDIEEPFKHVPKCYGTFITEDMEVLILENVKSCDYHLWNRSKAMNREHVVSVMKTYAKFHAISFALHDQKPEIFKKLADKSKDVLKMIMEGLVQTQKESGKSSNFDDVINLAKSKNQFGIVDKLHILKEESKRIHVLEKSNSFEVIAHGDCWNNNFMFKYQDDQKTKLTDLCLLDFQLCKLASPVRDLSYFLFTCISDEDVKDFDEIIGIYYDTLSDCLIHLGSDPKIVFPYEEMLDQWKKFAKFGLMMMTSIVKMCLVDQDEASDLTKTSEAGVEIQDAFVYKVKNDEEYAKRTLPLLQLAIDKQFI